MSFQTLILLELVHADYSLAGDDDDMGIHRVELVDGFSLEHVEIDVVEDLEGEGLLLGVRFKLHGEADEAWRSHLGRHVSSPAAHIVGDKRVDDHGSCLQNLLGQEKDALCRKEGQLVEDRRVLLRFLVVDHVLACWLDTALDRHL